MLLGAWRGAGPASIRTRQGGLGGVQLDLLSHAEIVTIGPVLGDLAVPHAEPVVPGDGGPAVGWREDDVELAVGSVHNERPGPPARHRGVHDDEVPVLDGVVDLPGQLREARRSQSAVACTAAGPAPRVSSGSSSPGR